MMCYVAKIREKLILSVKSAIGKSLPENLNHAKSYIILKYFQLPLEDIDPSRVGNIPF